MKNVVYNNQINNSSFVGKHPVFTKQEEDKMLALFFEQLLLFDYVVISTDRENFTLFFLLKKLGIETIERLFRAGYVRLSIKSAIIVSGTGRIQEDGVIDENVIYSQPPIAGGTLGGKDLDPEENIFKALRHFDLDKRSRRNLTKLIAPRYVTTDSMELSVDTTEFIIDAYLSNLLQDLGLPYEKEPNQLSIDERQKLLGIAHAILEMGIISKNAYKSYNNYGAFEIARSTYGNIGKAFKISENTSEILKIENTPDLQEIYLNNRFEISDIFILRHLSAGKYFRKWINEVGENENSLEVTEAYLEEIKGAKSFFDTTKGKIIKNTFLYGASSGLGSLIAGPIGGIFGAAAKPIVEIGVDYGLGLIEEFTVDSLLLGKNPKIFIDKLKEEINKEDK